MSNNEINEICKFFTAFYSDVDDSVKQFENTCKKGCSYCCCQAIEILYIEKFLIESFIHSQLKKDQFNTIKKNINNWLDYFQANTPDKEVISVDDYYNNFRIKIGDDKIPCPFLINDLCSIYHVRPLTCRAHFINKSPLTCKKDSLMDAHKDSKGIKDEGAIYILKHYSTFLTLLPLSLLKTFSISRNVKKMESPTLDSKFFD